MTTILQLPYPPAANNLFRNVPGRGRVKSGRYRLWEREAVLTIKAQVPGFKTIPGHYHLTIKATAPDKRRRDLANLEKAISDSLVTAGIVSDDSNLRMLNMFWANGFTSGGAIEVIVKEAA